MTKSEIFLSQDFAPTLWQLLCVRRGVYTHCVARTFFLTHSPCVAFRRHEHVWLKVVAGRMSYLSISPSPLSCFIRRPCCSRTVTSRPLFRDFDVLDFLAELHPERAGQAHERRGGVWLPGRPTHSTGYEPKEFDKITSVDGHTTPFNDPNHDYISNLSQKVTRGSTEKFGVPYTGCCAIRCAFFFQKIGRFCCVEMVLIVGSVCHIASSGARTHSLTKAE